MLRSKTACVLAIVALGSLFALAGCSSAIAHTTSRPKPSWVDTGTCSAPMLENSNAWICEVGMHTVSSPQQEGFAWTQAELDGTAALARKIAQMVVSKADAAAAELQLPDSQKAAFAAAKSTVQSALAAVRISSVQSMDRWWSGEHGTNAYRLVAISRADAMKTVDLTLPSTCTDRMLVVVFERAAEMGLE